MLTWAMVYLLKNDFDLPVPLVLIAMVLDVIIILGLFTTFN